MSLDRIDAAAAAGELGRFDAIIDARSPAEYALDHLPGAVNWPTLDDEQRRLVGTEYKQVSAFEARKHGAVMAARNIAAHLEREGPGLPRQWKPLVYCWRGGQRSGSLALVLSQVGFDVHVLAGGYRDFRRHVLGELEALPSGLQFRVLCGPTGSGKSRLLAALVQAGAQVLDLEGLACHRGSVLGGLPGGQPSQKRFEMQLWSQLRSFDTRYPVFVESESRTIGRLRLPESLLLRMRSGDCLDVSMPLAGRIELLLQDYDHFVRDPQAFCERLRALQELRGAAVVQRWQSMILEGQTAAVVAELLEQHYDPIYRRSTQRNFIGLASARPVALEDGSPVALQRAARELVPTHPADPGG